MTSLDLYRTEVKGRTLDRVTWFESQLHSCPAETMQVSESASLDSDSFSVQQGRQCYAVREDATSME